MPKAVQARTLATRMRLLDVARERIAQNGFEALRIEEIVQSANVAKGTFFAHFKDKDALMDLLIGERINFHLDRIETLPPPQTVEEVVEALLPLLEAMTCERYVFDVIVRYSGAAAIEEIGVIARTFERQLQVQANWLAGDAFRHDVSPELLSEGVQAFAVQAMALKFCALHNSQSIRERLMPYLKAWLLAPA